MSLDQGIQPIAPSSFGVFEWFGWSLPGHGKPNDDCGKTMIFGCLNVEAHTQSRIDGENVLNKVFLDLRRHSCGRLECPICYEKACSKEAHRITWRLENSWLMRHGKIIHVAVSVPKSLYHLSGEELRSKVYAKAKKVGFFGGSDIFHPAREVCVLCGSNKDNELDRCENCGCSEFRWYYSPHFHLLGFGWIDGNKVAELYKKEGWIIKNLGIRVSVESTAFYQLSHCGIHKKHHSVTWFGNCSYNKLRIPKEEIEKKVCPLCGSELIKLHWIGNGDMPIPNEEGEYFVDPGGWEEDHFQISKHVLAMHRY